jgi:predicted Zn finger-like uncharacterized protein
MYSVCPECTTVFRITAGHLHAAGGLVRCGRCHHLYSAINHVYDEIPAARAVVAAHRGAAGRASSGGASHGNEEGAPVTLDMAAAVGVAGARPAAVATPFETGFGRDWRQPALLWRDVISGAGIGLLILLLGIQWLYFNRNALAGDSAWRPTMERFCDFLQCDLPLRVDLEQIELLDRDVRKHPAADDALLINATIINHARHVQPYPLFSVSFSNLSGKPVALRHFRPAEYLGETAAHYSGMIPDTPVHAVLEIADPGEDAVSFQLDFL